MPIGIGEDHEELRRTVRRWLEARCPPAVARALLDAETETMPPFWDELAAPGLARASTWPRSTAARASACSSSPWSSRRWPGP